MARRAPPPDRGLAAPWECGEREACHSGVTALSTPTTPRRWTPVALVVAAALGLGGLAGAGSLAVDDDRSAAGPGGRLAVQDYESR
jgi:hypothetical protein